MHSMTPRDATRRWYGQVKNQSPNLADSLKTVVAHTIIPDASRLAFGESNFVPLSGALDLILHSEVNSVGEVVGLTLRGYKASYDTATNTFQIGGAHNLKILKDLRLRPFRGAYGRIIDPETELALLITALEMDGEREIVFKNPNFDQIPNFSEALLSFTDDNIPRFEDSVGLRQLTWHALQPNSWRLASLCAPKDYSGSVRRVIRDHGVGVTLIELDQLDSPFEIPSWAKVLVRQGMPIENEQPLASISLSLKVVEPLKRANKTFDSVWSALRSYIGNLDLDHLLHLVWDSEVQKWAGMTLMPSHILTPSHARWACAVWRDLRGSLNRVCHGHRNPNMVVRSAGREGSYSAWDLHCLPDDPKVFQFDTFAGMVDLSSLPQKFIKPVFNASFVQAVELKAA